MRGRENKQTSMLSIVSPEQRVPEKHPLRRIKAMADAGLRELSPLLDAMYSVEGWPSIPPERLLLASLLMAFYTVRSERLFVAGCRAMNVTPQVAQNTARCSMRPARAPAGRSAADQRDAVAGGQLDDLHHILFAPRKYDAVGMPLFHRAVVFVQHQVFGSCEHTLGAQQLFEFAQQNSVRGHDRGLFATIVSTRSGVNVTRSTVPCCPMRSFAGLRR